MKVVKLHLLLRTQQVESALLKPNLKLQRNGEQCSVSSTMQQVKQFVLRTDIEVSKNKKQEHERSIKPNKPNQAKTALTELAERCGHQFDFISTKQLQKKTI